MIIITVKHKSRISLLKLVVPTISFISSKKRNHFLSRYFRRVVILGETESIKLLFIATLEGSLLPGVVTLGTLRCSDSDVSFYSIVS